MNHSEAVAQMAAERYLLDELGPDVRDEFEEHLFDCVECVLDVRAGDAFIREAKLQLPGLTAADAAKVAGTPVRTKLEATNLPEANPAETNRTDMKPARHRRDWFAWLRPLYLAPAFALLLGVAGYQNLVTLPGLRSALESPRIVISAPLRTPTRGAEHQKLTATREDGLALPVNLLPEEFASENFAAYSVALVGPDGKTAWTGTVPAPISASASQGAQATLVIPGAMLKDGSYTVTVAGIGHDGSRTETERYVFDLTVKE
jgi:hypothetical protein